ncbi:MAG: S-layer homology domain-containing protein, partial [Syntrophomonas sp.]
KDIRAGDKISGVVLKDLNQFIELQAFSNIVYGRVLYYNPDQATVSLLDSNNRFWQLNIPDLSYIVSGGMKAGVSLAPGSWVRIVLKPGSTSILRADLAIEKQQDMEKIYRHYDQEKQLIYMTDGSSYQYTPETQMTKNGYKFTPDLLSSGEGMVITTLDCPDSSQEFLARVEVKVNTSVNLPALEASASKVNNVLVIRGTTTANKIVVIRQDGSREYIPVNNDGSFSSILPVQPSEQSVSVLAVDTRTGGLQAKNLEVKSLDQTPVKTYVDILSDPDRSSIEKLASRSIVSGYGDGSFRPGETINRADFLSILGRAGEWQVEKPYQVKYFADNGDIPDWALGSVYFARQRGYISGYPDQTFKPANSLTRDAMVAIIAQIFPANVQETAQNNQPYLDSGNIPSWAQHSYRVFQQRGWLELFGRSDYLEPERPLTRGEAARFIDRIMLKV